MKTLNKKNIGDILALTPMQEGMLFHYLKDPGNDANFEQLYLEISGKLERGLFEKAWNFVIGTNEMLRTVFRWENLKQPAQLVMEEHCLDFRYFDLSGKSSDERNISVENIKTADRNEKFDLQDVPFRVTLCKIDEIKYGIIVSNHHILYDGWSNGIILKEFFNAYNDLSAGRVPEMLFKTKFREFIRWSQNRDREKEEEFWKEYLKGFERKNEHDTHDALSKKVIAGTAKLQFEIPPETVTRLNDFSIDYKISLTQLIYTAWGILLQKYHDAADVMFDTTVSGRSAKVKGIEHLVGLFINTLPVRVNTRPGETVTALLTRFKKMQRKWEEFENTSTLTLKEYTGECRNPVCFDSVVVVENYPLDTAVIQKNSEFSIDSFSNTGMTRYDLTVLISGSGPINIELSYNVHLFRERTASLVGRHFISILDEIVSSPRQTVPEIHILPGEEVEEITKTLTGGREYEPGTAIESEFTAPRNTVEEKLVEIWSDVLKRRVGIDHNFFDFGGHSLKASLLAAKMHREFNVKIPLSEIFRRPTVRELARYISNIKGVSEAAHTPLKFVEEKSYYPLSSAQKRMAALQRLDPESTAYNVSSAVEVQGPMDTMRLTEVFNRLIARHEIFRTSFQDMNGESVQKIQPDVDFEIESAEPRHNGFVRPFDLSQAPLLRVGLVKAGEERHLLIIDMHHIITDGVSIDQFIKEFTALYKGEQLPLLKHQYKDFSQWQTHRLNTGELKPQEEYWLEHLSGELPLLNLRTDFPRPSVQCFDGDRIVFHLDVECYRKLRKLAGQTGTTLFMVFLAALNILLSRYTSQEDIIIGTTIAGRDHIDIQNIMGLFIETLALRNKPVGNKHFRTFLNEVKENTLNAFENSAYPFRELIEKVGAAGDIGRNPLFNVMLIVQNVDMAPLEIEGLTFTPVDIRSTDSKVDFTVEVFEDKAGIRFNLEYSTALFRKDTMERLGGHFIAVLNEVSSRRDVLLREIEMLSDHEMHRLLDELSGQKNNVTGEMDLSVHQLFEEQTVRTPGNIAVVYEDNRLSYQNLNEKAHLLSEIIKGL